MATTTEVPGAVSVPTETRLSNSSASSAVAANAAKLAVNAAAAAGRDDGVLFAEPVYAGPIVGYFCLLSDPDGNVVEFSYGQPIDPRTLPERERAAKEPPLP